MTAQQYNTLKAHKHIYDFFLRVQTVNTAHPSIGAINEVMREMGQPMDLSCSKCVAAGLPSIYEQYFKYESEHGIN